MFGVVDRSTCFLAVWATLIGAFACKPLPAQSVTKLPEMQVEIAADFEAASFEFGAPEDVVNLLGDFINWNPNLQQANLISSTTGTQLTVGATANSVDLKKDINLVFGREPIIRGEKRDLSVLAKDPGALPPGIYEGTIEGQWSSPKIPEAKKWTRKLIVVVKGRSLLDSLEFVSSDSSNAGLSVGDSASFRFRVQTVAMDLGRGAVSLRSQHSGDLAKFSVPLEGPIDAALDIQNLESAAEVRPSFQCPEWNTATFSSDVNLKKAEQDGSYLVQTWEVLVRLPQLFEPGRFSVEVSWEQSDQLIVGSTEREEINVFPGARIYPELATVREQVEFSLTATEDLGPSVPLLVSGASKTGAVEIIASKVPADQLAHASDYIEYRGSFFPASTGEFRVRLSTRANEQQKTHFESKPVDTIFNVVFNTGDLGISANEFHVFLSSPPPLYEFFDQTGDARGKLINRKVPHELTGSDGWRLQNVSLRAITDSKGEKLNWTDEPKVWLIDPKESRNLGDARPSAKSLEELYEEMEESGQPTQPLATWSKLPTSGDKSGEWSVAMSLSVDPQDGLYTPGERQFFIRLNLEGKNEVTNATERRVMMVPVRVKIMNTWDPLMPYVWAVIPVISIGVLFGLYWAGSKLSSIRSSSPTAKKNSAVAEDSQEASDDFWDENSLGFSGGSEETAGAEDQDPLAPSTFASDIDPEYTTESDPLEPDSFASDDFDLSDETSSSDSDIFPGD